MKKIIKNYLRPIAFYGGLPYFKIALRRVSGKKYITILLYHKISPKASPFFGQSVSPKVFEEQIQFLKKNFQIIGFRDLRSANRIQNNQKDAVIITFDDGYKDNFLHAYPILKKYDIPATIFLATDFIGTGKLLWPDKLAWILYRTAAIPDRNTLIKFEISKEIIHGIEKLFQSKSLMRLEILRSLADSLKDYPMKQLENILGGLAEACKIKEWPEGQIHPMLAWDEVKNMSLKGIEFGSHTKSHLILSKIPLNMARREIVESKKEIEKHIQKPVTTFAYPFGKKEDYSESIIKIIQEVGFKYACSTEIGHEKIPLQNPFILKRKGVVPYPYLFI
jgi:peptidoglycan/xylan/chitin deacetylase (PgdA/CDA1 family)